MKCYQKCLIEKGREIRIERKNVKVFMKYF